MPMPLQSLYARIQAVEAQIRDIAAHSKPHLVRGSRPGTDELSDLGAGPRWAQELAKALDHVSTSVRELSKQLPSPAATRSENTPAEQRETDAPEAADRGDATQGGYRAGGLATLVGDVTTAAEAVPGPAPGSFCLAASDMGECLIQGLARFAAERPFGKITVAGLAQTDWPALAASIKPPPDHDLFYIKHAPDPRGDGLSRLMLSTARHFQLPDFAQAVQKPSPAECEQFLDHLIHDPPRKRIPYYVGPTAAFSDLLHPGAELRDPRLGRLSGINEHWCHAGAARSGTAFHREDAGFRSCNLTLFGWKLWLLVRPAQTEQFEALVHRLGGGTGGEPCDQFVRHRTLLVTPSRLRREGIEHDIYLTGPGEMIFTAPRQYHYVVNMTTSFAVAINFLLPGEEAIPPDLTLCPDCGLFPLRQAFPDIRLAAGPSAPVGPKDEEGEPTPRTPVRKKPKMHTGAPSPSGPTTRSRRPGVMPRDDAPLSEWLAHLQRHDPCYRAPRPREAALGPKLLRLFYACRGCSAVEGLVDIVEGWRQQEPSEWELLATYHAAVRCLAGLARLIDQLENRMRLHALLGVLLKVELADYIDETCAHERLDAADWDKVWGGLSTTDRPPDDCARRNRKLSEWRTVGRKMRRFPLGLLCLAPSARTAPYYVSYSTLASCTDKEVDLLVAALRTDRRGGHLLHQCAPLVECLSKGHDIPEFKWEGPQAPNVASMSDDETLIRWVAPLPCPTFCVYDPIRFRDTAKPAGWPGDWPADPTTGHGFDGQCDFCTAQPCQCRGPALPEPASSDGYYPPCQQGREPVRLVLRARDDGGRGIFVKGPRGRVVFEKGRPLGEVVGELAPPGSHESNGGFVWDVERADLPGAPLVYQIYCGEVGNWTRRIGHRCRDPSAFLRAGMLSGRHVVRVLASRDLVAGDEVTIRCRVGDSSFACRCQDCRAQA